MNFPRAGGSSAARPLSPLTTMLTTVTVQHANLITIAISPLLLWLRHSSDRVNGPIVTSVQFFATMGSTPCASPRILMSPSRTPWQLSRRIRRCGMDHRRSHKDRQHGRPSARARLQGNHLLPLLSTASMNANISCVALSSDSPKSALIVVWFLPSAGYALAEMPAVWSTWTSR